MEFKYEMPTSVYFGKNVVREHKEVFQKVGKRALIVTGHHSAKKNGAYEDVAAVLSAIGTEFVLFDEVEENPSLDTVERGAQRGREARADFVVGIGGGSPMDAAKAIALFLKNPQIDKNTVFNSGKLESIPVIAVATTSGTGSEVTPYSIVTSDAEKTKKNLGQVIFPAAAFLDSKYTYELPYEITVHTAIDAFTHLAEGYLNTNSTCLSDMYAEKGFSLFAGCFENLLQKDLNEDFRDRIMMASTLAGIEIAQTGTSLPHGMGYALTYFKGLPHGIANGVLIPEYLKSFQNTDKLVRMLSLLKLEGLYELERIFHQLIRVEFCFSQEEILLYSKEFMSNKVKLKNHTEAVMLDDIVRIYEGALAFL
ncbi:MAG: iron-containing alcohol dehydrogenase family protein [Lachnospiraceae bacterium]